MGHWPSWLPVAPSHGGRLADLTVWLPAFLVPVRFATEGLAWVRTSGGWAVRWCFFWGGGNFKEGKGRIKSWTLCDGLSQCRARKRRTPTPTKRSGKNPIVLLKQPTRTQGMCVNDNNKPQKRVVRLLCCVVSTSLIFPKAYKIFDATVQNFLLKAVENTAL